MSTDQRTIVRHSGYGYAGNPQFARGLETRAVATKALAGKIRKAGGLLFEGPDGGYGAAESYAEAEMYRTTSGLIPAAPGTFAELEVDGLAVYIPPTG